MCISCIIWCRCKRCKYCNESIRTASYDYCDGTCEFNDIFKDSFKVAGSFEQKYIYNLRI